MEYLTICFEEKCRLQHKQIFSARDQDSQLHQLHDVKSIHPHSTFIRSLKTKPIQFNENIRQVYSQLQEQYNKSVERVKQAFKVSLQQCERRIMDIYELSEKEVNLTLIEPHLRQKTQQTELWLALMNWKKAHTTEDMKNYIENLPKTLIKDYKTTTNKLVDSLLANIPKSSNNISEQSHKSNIQTVKADVKDSSRVIQGISKQISDIYDRSIKPKQFPKIQEILLVKRKNDQNEETLKQLAEKFCNLQLPMHYQYIGYSLLSKILTKDIYQSDLGLIIKKVCLKIEGQLSKDLRDRRMIASNIYFFWTDFTRFHYWMRKQESGIFSNCIRLFMNLNRDIVISPNEIQMVYVVIITRMMDKVIKNIYGQSPNIPSLRFQRQVIYLYSKYSSFYNVMKILKRKYPTLSLEQLKQSIQQKCKKIVIDTYNQIKEREFIQDANFQMLIRQEKDFSQNAWGTILQKYIQYRNQGKLEKSVRQSLVETMKAVVKNRLPLGHISSQVTDPSLDTDETNGVSYLTSSLLPRIKEIFQQKRWSLQCSSIVKSKQLSNSKLNDNERMQKQSSAQSNYH